MPIHGRMVQPVEVPSIRGAVLKQSIDWLGSLVVAKRTTPMALGIRLEAEDFALFMQRIEGEAWYPVASAGRIDDALVLAHGGAAERIMCELGARRARKILAATPSPLSALGKAREALTPADLFGILPPLNFGHWHSESTALDDFTLCLEDAAPLPTTTRYNLQGFLQCLASEITGKTVQVRSHTERRGRVVFRGARPSKPADPTRSDR